MGYCNEFILLYKRTHESEKIVKKCALVGKGVNRGGYPYGFAGDRGPTIMIMEFNYRNIPMIVFYQTTGRNTGYREPATRYKSEDLLYSRFGIDGEMIDDEKSPFKYCRAEKKKKPTNVYMFNNPAYTENILYLKYDEMDEILRNTGIYILPDSCTDGIIESVYYKQITDANMQFKITMRHVDLEFKVSLRIDRPSEYSKSIKQVCEEFVSAHNRNEFGRIIVRIKSGVGWKTLINKGYYDKLITSPYNDQDSFIELVKNLYVSLKSIK